MAHQEAWATVQRHLPFWLQENPRILFTCPQDSMIDSDHPVVAIGRAGHHAEVAIRRFKGILRFMTSLRADWFTLHEYDSIIFSSVDQLPCEPGVLYSNLCPNCPKPEPWDPTEHPGRGFLGFHYTHPPLRMDHATLCRLSEALDREPDGIERGFWDRAVGYVCEKNGIPMQGWGWDRLGCSANTIHPGPLLEWAAERRREGAVCYHGIKDREVLERLA